MAGLEDFVRPGHGDGDCGTKAEADQEESTVSWPGIGEATGVCCDEETRDLDEDGHGKEKSAVVMEAIGYWGDEENRDEVHLTQNQQRTEAMHAKLHTTQIGAKSRLKSILDNFGFVACMMTVP